MSKLPYAIAVNMLINNLHMYVHSDVTLHQTSMDATLEHIKYHILIYISPGIEKWYKYR